MTKPKGMLVPQNNCFNKPKMVQLWLMVARIYPNTDAYPGIMFYVTLSSKARQMQDCSSSKCYSATKDRCYLSGSPAGDTEAIV